MHASIKPALAGLALAAAAATAPVAQASSTASSASLDSLTASSGGLSDSVRGSSNSSSRATGVAEGDYKVIEVAAGDKPATVRMKLQAVAGDGEFFLRVPQQAFDRSGVAQGERVGVKQRPYGLEFANGQTRQPFFLALNDDALRELQNHAVAL